MKKILAIILSLVILSNLTFSVALAQTPETSLSENKSTSLKSKLKPKQKNTKLTDKEKQIESLEKEISKIKNMSDKDYKWNKFESNLKKFFTYIGIVGIFFEAFFVGYLQGLVDCEGKIREISSKNAIETNKLQKLNDNLSLKLDFFKDNTDFLCNLTSDLYSSAHLCNLPDESFYDRYDLFAFKKDLQAPKSYCDWIKNGF